MVRVTEHAGKLEECQGHKGRDGMERVGQTDYVFKWGAHQGMVKDGTLLLILIRV